MEMLNNEILLFNIYIHNRDIFIFIFIFGK